MIRLVDFDKNNNDHVLFYKKLINDETISKRFTGLLPNLMRPASNAPFNKGYLVSIDNTLVGYIDISNYNDVEKAIYLRAAIEKSARKHNYGSQLLIYISKYLFTAYPQIEHIKLKIDVDNIASQKVAEKAGYTYLYSDYYGLDNPYLEFDNKKR